MLLFVANGDITIQVVCNLGTHTFYIAKTFYENILISNHWDLNLSFMLLYVQNIVSEHIAKIYRQTCKSFGC